MSYPKDLEKERKTHDTKQENQQRRTEEKPAGP